MTLLQLMEIADRGYRKDFPESGPLDVCHLDGRPYSLAEYEAAGRDDTLVYFLAHELYETFEPDTSAADQMVDASDAALRAAQDLINVSDALLAYAETTPL